MNPLDAMFGTYVSERDEVAIEVGKRKQYPWKYTNIWTGEPVPFQATNDDERR